MRSHHLLLLSSLFCGAAIAGCHCTVTTGKTPPKPPPLPPTVVDRYVGLVAQPGADCPAATPTAAGTWVASKVFVAGPGEQLPRSMRDLCAYDWKPAQPGGVPDPAGLPGAQLASLAEDPPVVTTLGPLSPTPDQARLLTRLRDSFREQVGALAALPRPATPAQLRPVTLGLPDSSPRNYRTSGTVFAPSDPFGGITLGPDPHGYNLGWMMRTLTCPEGDACASKLILEPALNRNTPGGQPNGDRVGSYGTPAELASAIKKVVDEWKLRKQRDDDGSPLVLNLSVGWEPDFECRRPKERKGGIDVATHVPELAAAESGDGVEVFDLPPPPEHACPDGYHAQPDDSRRSVHGAITYAACHGALVIAAAGNDMGYAPRLEGPMYPARWETEPRPDPGTCWNAFHIPSPGASPPPTATSGYKPLLHAIGGVGPTDARIPISRRGGRPRLAAPASLAVGFPGSTPPSSLYPLSGTSAAAAVVSSVAAVVWAYRPRLAADDVMDIVYGTAGDLRRSADFCLAGPPCAPIHRVSLCGAVHQACSPSMAAPPDDYRACPVTPVVCVPRPTPPAADAEPPDPPPGTLSFPRDLLRVTYGQPGRPACPECTVYPKAPDTTSNPDWSWKLAGKIDPAFFDENKVSLQSPTLRLYSDQGALLATSDSITPEMTGASGPYDVRGSGSVPSQPRIATLTWTQKTVDGTVSLVTQEVVLAPPP